MGAEFFILLVAGFLLGILAVVFGGTMFFTIPLMQWLFPQAGFGTIVGNAKVGSLFRSIGSTIATHRDIAYLQNIKLSAVAFAGTIIGASIISGLDQKWLFPAVSVAIVFALAAPRLAPLITPRRFHAVAFGTGIYAGFFGAGIGVLLVALLRLRHPADTDIAFVKIQARFVEFLLVITAVATHFWHGNLVPAIWVPWSLGGLAGGLAGGVILRRIGHLSGDVQRMLLYISFALAFLFSAYAFFKA